MDIEQGRLYGKTAVITGAGSGIGLAMTRLFAAQGARIAAIYRQEANLPKLQDIYNVTPIQSDITRLDSIEQMGRIAEDQLGTIDILCNVAGINDLCYPLDETTDERWDSVLGLDLKAPFQLCRRFLAGMIRKRSGVILNIASYAATRGNHGASYSAAKHGLIGLTKHIAAFYGARGIRCNAINPGGVRNTGITSNSGGAYHKVGFQVFLDITSRLPVKWVCEPEDIAPVALFLCSEEAKHVNGAEVSVDGGMSSC